MLARNFYYSAWRQCHKQALGVRKRNSSLHSAFIGHFIGNMQAGLHEFSRMRHGGDRDVLEIKGGDVRPPVFFPVNGQP
jgi:hypothetical protein